MRAALPLLAVCGVLVVAACGEDDPGSSTGGPSASSQTTSTPAQGPAGGRRCQDVAVPGHEAVDVRSEGAACDTAEEVAAAAEGRGRTAYEAGGFACEPSPASGGDTTYRCTMGSARITFLYGTR